jgi:hypothetical protein
MNSLLFLAPFSGGTEKREAAAPKASGCLMGGPVPFCDLNHRLAILDASLGRNSRIGSVHWKAFRVRRSVDHARTPRERRAT